MFNNYDTSTFGICWYSKLLVDIIVVFLLQLCGTEVKSCRKGQVQLSDGHVQITGNYCHCHGRIHACIRYIYTRVYIYTLLLVGFPLMF